MMWRILSIRIPDRVGLIDNNFSYSAAIGLFKNVLGFALMIAVNQLTKTTNKHGA